MEGAVGAQGQGTVVGPIFFHCEEPWGEIPVLHGKNKD